MCARSDRASRASRPSRRSTAKVGEAYSHVSPTVPSVTCSRSRTPNHRLLLYPWQASSGPCDTVLGIHAAKYLGEQGADRGASRLGGEIMVGKRLEASTTRVTVAANSGPIQPPTPLPAGRRGPSTRVHIPIRCPKRPAEDTCRLCENLRWIEKDP